MRFITLEKLHLSLRIVREKIILEIKVLRRYEEDRYNGATNGRIKINQDILVCLLNCLNFV